MRTKKILLICAVIMSAVFIITANSLALSAKAADYTQAQADRNDPDEIMLAVLDDARYIEDMEPVYSLKNVTLQENEGYQEFRYLSFDIPEDSWVYMGGGFSLNNHDGASVHADIYGSRAYTKKTGGFGWGYYEYDKTFCGFMKKGSYCIELKAKQANYGDYTGNIDLYAARIPVSDVFHITQKLSKNKKSVRVTLDNRLADYMNYVQYKRGRIGSSRIKSQNAWIYKSSGFFLNIDAATLLKNHDDRYSFTVKKNGKYTILITDTAGSRYQKVISVRGIRKNKK